MIGNVRVLHLLHESEHQPPPNLVKAAGSVRLMRAGHPLDDATRSFWPQVITLCAPFDHDTRRAIELVEVAELPILGIGETSTLKLSAYVSAAISAADLRTVLDLLSDNTREHAGHYDCAREGEGQCRGPVADDFIRLLEHLLALRMPDYRERAEKVLESCLWMGNHLCLPSTEMKNLVRAARLREIGKLGISDRILFARRSERTRDEQNTYDRYPSLGSRVLGELPELRKVAHIIEYQLENFDGSGLAGLMSHQIPLGSRILRVAGAMAMIMENQGHHVEIPEVVSALEDGRGSLYDPLLVRLVQNFFSANQVGDEDRKNIHWVRLDDLSEDMVIVEDVWSRTGMKLIPAGTRLNTHLLKIIKQFPIDPSLESVRVRLPEN
jgi:HD-GYP domain-containing protein (c-di-GMP phosphodiesterase class II)